MLFGLEIGVFCVVVAIYVLGGYVKGAIGFALPIIAVAGGATVMDGPTAVATLILPSLFTNVMQAFREGLDPLIAALRRFWLSNLVLMVAIACFAPLLVWLPERVFLLILGGSVGLFGVAQLVGWRPSIAPRYEKPWGVGVGVASGFFGGVAGTWGPPFVIYLTALKVPKAEHVRASGVFFLLGGIVMAPSHMLTGVFNERTALISLCMIPAAVLGMHLGQRVQDRLDQEVFRRFTLIVLIISSLNLLRRAAFG